MKHAMRRRILRANPPPPSPDQAAALLGWIRRRPRGGRRLHAFFATLYYCGPRPGEAVAVRVKDVILPASGDEDQWSELLIHTATPEVGRQWTGTGKIHERCCPHVLGSLTGKRVYDNRHTRLTKWLNDGIPPAQVVDWAGNSVPVLLATYARCVEGQLPDLKRRLEAAGDLPELPDVG